MQITRADVNRSFRVGKTGWDSGDWQCRVIDWQGELYIRHEVGEYAGNITPASTFNTQDCDWIDSPQPQSALSRAVAITREAKELDLKFEDLIDYFWEYNGDSLTYSDLAIDILDETGNAMCLEVCYMSDEDANYIRFHVDDGCGEKYDVVLDKTKRLEVE